MSPAKPDSLFLFVMRLDLFLKASRLILRRTLAQQFCDKGLVKINGIKAKSSREVKSADEITIKRGNKLLIIKVLQIPNSKQVSRQDAASLYEVVSEETLSDAAFDPFVEIEDNSANPIK